MSLETLIQQARSLGASDVHLEGGLPATFRVRGELKMIGEPVPGAELTAMATRLLGEGFAEMLERGSADFSRTIEGQRCRVNVMRSARGIGFAIRLLSSFQATLRTLNLHPDLIRLVEPNHGLVLVSGPTGSGKTSTLAALLQELNLREARHIITVESPIEYALAPRRSFIRQREVGRDTPSFSQALLDALREDPDVLMVGEMREPEVMRLTLNAAETGHLVLATVHSAGAAEALQRVVSAFAPESQASVCAQLADVLVGVVAQRLRYREDVRLRVPECEVLMASTPVRALVRSGQFFKLASALETGAADGSFSFARYGEWLSRRTDWAIGPGPEPVAELPGVGALGPALPATRRAVKSAAAKPPAPAAVSTRPHRAAAPPKASEDGALVIEEEDDPEAVLSELEATHRD